MKALWWVLGIGALVGAFAVFKVFDFNNSQGTGSDHHLTIREINPLDHVGYEHVNASRSELEQQAPALLQAMHEAQGGGPSKIRDKSDVSSAWQYLQKLRGRNSQSGIIVSFEIREFSVEGFVG